MRGRHPAGNGAVGGEHASVVGSTFVQVWAARSSVVGSTFVQMWAARVLGGTFLGSTRFWAARVRHESAVASSFAVLADRERLQAGRCFPMCLSVAGSRFTALWVALTGRIPVAQWTRLYSVDETIFMCGIYDYRARRVLFAVQLQDRGEHRARFVTANEIFENVVITLFNFEQGTDGNYHDCITSYIYSVWIVYVEP